MKKLTIVTEMTVDNFEIFVLSKFIKPRTTAIQQILLFTYFNKEKKKKAIHLIYNITTTFIL